MTQDEKLVNLINEYADDPEVYEVCMYVLHSATTAMAAEAAQSNKLMEMRNIPPESIMMMNRFSSGMVANEFFHKNFATISTAVAMDHLQSKVLFANARHGHESSDAATIVRDQVANKYSALSMVIFLHGGYDAAFEFKMKLASVMQTSPENVKACLAMV